MNTTVTVIARIEAKSDQIQRVKTALLKLIEPTRAEEGCLQYDLHQDHESPEVFFFYENWTSRPLLQTHMGREHMQNFRTETAEAIGSMTLNETSKIA